MKHSLITTSSENYVLLLPIEKENAVNLQVIHSFECFRQPLTASVYPGREQRYGNDIDH